MSTNPLSLGKKEIIRNTTRLQEFTLLRFKRWIAL